MKGFAASGGLVVIAVILGVIFLFVVVPRMFESISIAQAFDPLGYQKRLAGLQAGDDLESAIECAYARCFAEDSSGKGCKSSEVQGIRWFEGTAKCTDFCDSKFQDDDDRICNEQARAHPVIFNSIEPISAIIQSGDIGTVQCIAPTPSDVCASGGFGKSLQSTSGKPVLYLDLNLIKSADEEGAGLLPWKRKCAGKLDLVKYGENVVTLVPVAAPLKVVKAGSTASKVATAGKGVVTSSKYLKAGTAAALASEAFFSQIKIIKTATLHPIKGELYIWANDEGRGIGGKFLNAISNIASAHGGTRDNLVLCANDAPRCKGTALPCEQREDSDKCTENLKCKWVNSGCVTIEDGPKACELIYSESECFSQPGCHWGDVVELTKERFRELYRTLLNEDPDETELDGFFKALDKAGGQENALAIWGGGATNNIVSLFLNPELASLDSWSDFIDVNGEINVCNDGLEILPGGCSRNFKYCSVKNKQWSLVDYPKICGCQPGSGTKVDQGELGVNGCQPFDSNEISSIQVDVLLYLQDKDSTPAPVRADGYDSQIVIIRLLDKNDVVVTGTELEDYVTIQTNLGGFIGEDEPNGPVTCLPSGNVSYYSCSARIVSQDAGEATVIATYEKDGTKRQGSTKVQFTNAKISGTVDVIANGQNYSSLRVSVFKLEDNDPSKEGDYIDDATLNFEFDLPTDKDQRVSYVMGGLPNEERFILVVYADTSKGQLKSNHDTDCPDAPVTPHDRECVVGKNAVQNFRIYIDPQPTSTTVPTATPTAVPTPTPAPIPTPKPQPN